VRAPFRLERYLADLRDRTAWAPDCPIEDADGPTIGRATLHRIAHLWALALLDDRFDTLLLPVLASSTDLLDTLDAESRRRGWELSREFFQERLESRACLLLIDGAAGVAERYPGNAWFMAV
jgi:hypothetical protein